MLLTDALRLPPRAPAAASFRLRLSNGKAEVNAGADAVLDETATQDEARTHAQRAGATLSHLTRAPTQQPRHRCTRTSRTLWLTR